MSNLGRLAPLFFLCALGGCATLGNKGERVAYTPLGLTRTSSPAAVLAATETLMIQLGATTVERGASSVHAVFDHEGTARDVVSVSVSDARVEIDYQTEIALSEGIWLHPHFTCGTYSYAREHALAQRIVEEAYAQELRGTLTPLVVTQKPPAAPSSQRDDVTHAGGTI